MLKNTGTHLRTPCSCIMGFDKVYKVYSVGGQMFDLRRVCLAQNPCTDLYQMIAVARANMATLKLPHKNPKIKGMGWTKEQGEKVAQKIHEYGYIEVYECRERYGDDLIDEMIKEHVVCYRPGPMWCDDLSLPEGVKFPIITAPTLLHLYVLKNGCWLLAILFMHNDDLSTTQNTINCCFLYLNFQQHNYYIMTV